MNACKHVSEVTGFPWSLLDELKCPCCDTRLQVASEVRSSNQGLRDGVLRCDCYEYPVVSGIAVLRQMSAVSSTRNDAVDRLRYNDPDGALQCLIRTGTAVGVPSLEQLRPKAKLWARLTRGIRNLFGKNTPTQNSRLIPIEAGFKAALLASRPTSFANYLFHRFANPSFLGAIPPLVVFGQACGQNSRRRVLDLLCGTGHASAILGALFEETEIIAADIDFVNLFLARRLVAPRAAALCMDAELPLPLQRASVDGLLCLDGLHYVRSKVALLREVDRIMSADGIWLFPHLHNATVVNENPGVPLSAMGYATRFAFGLQRLVAESEILHQFQTGGYLDLTAQCNVESLTSSKALTLIGARADSLWKRHLALDKILCDRPQLLGFNPLYRIEEAPDGLMLKQAWPSDSLRRECSEKPPIMPECVRVPSRVADDIVAAGTNDSLSDDVRKLVRSFVLVYLPRCYLPET